MSTKSLLSLSSAELRALATPEAEAEIARRLAKREATGKWTVAALRAHGKTAEADARVAAAKAKTAIAKVAPVASAPAPAKAPKAAPVAKVATQPAMAFTRTTEVIENPKSAVANLHNRMCGVEKALLSIAATQASMHEALTILVKRSV